MVRQYLTSVGLIVGLTLLFMAFWVLWYFLGGR